MTNIEAKNHVYNPRITSNEDIFNETNGTWGNRLMSLKKKKKNSLEILQESIDKLIDLFTNNILVNLQTNKHLVDLKVSIDALTEELKKLNNKSVPTHNIDDRKK